MSTQQHTETEETLKHAHAMFILDHTGHTTLAWDAVEEAKDIVAQARAKFEAHVKNGHTAYTTDKNGGNATMVKDFDTAQKAERIVLAPRLVGG